MASGKSVVLMSSLVTTNAPVDYKFDVLGFAKTTIYAVVDAITSGASLTLNINAYPTDIGEPAAGASLTTPLIASGDVTLASGQAAKYTISDSYDRLGVGVMNGTANKSGRVTVTISRKRR